MLYYGQNPDTGFQKQRLSFTFPEAFSFTRPLFTARSGKDGSLYRLRAGKLARIFRQKGIFMHILLIEDDKNLCDILTYQLEQEGFSVDLCHDGRDGLDLMLQNAHDLIILDRMLPTMNGLMALQKARANHIETPVILLTALGELYDRIEGLDCGADDYIVKPFAFEELMARIRTIRRRSRSIIAPQILTLGDLRYDISLRQLSTEQGQLVLSKREGRLLEVFLGNPDTVLPRLVILSRVWGPDAEVEEGNLDNYVHFLRKRLRYVKSRLCITTIRGIGYKLETDHV